MVAALFPTEPEQLLGPQSPHVASTGQPLTRRPYDSGIHLRRHRCGQGAAGSGPQALGHSQDRGLRCGWHKRLGIGVAVPGTVDSGPGVHRWPGTALGRRPGRGVPARGGGQSPPGAGLPQGHWPLGQDRCAGRPGHSPFCRGGPPCHSSSPGLRHPGTPLPKRTAYSGSGNAGGGEEPAGAGPARPSVPASGPI